MLAIQIHTFLPRDRSSRCLTTIAVLIFMMTTSPLGLLQLDRSQRPEPAAQEDGRQTMVTQDSSKVVARNQRKKKGRAEAAETIIIVDLVLDEKGSMQVRIFSHNCHRRLIRRLQDPVDRCRILMTSFQYVLYFFVGTSGRKK